VWSRKDARRAPPKSLADLAEARFLHIAIANPETAPYGLAAKQALTTAGLWEKVAKHLAYGENVRQTLQLAETGNADVAIVAQSLATPSTGTWFIVDEKLHAPLEQALVVCTRGGNRPGAEAFARFVTSPKGVEILRRYGLDPPAAP
jgi:molybdate transport system substrate-binding protein